jgi:hypothetical protein
MSKKPDPILEKLDVLSKKIDMLAMVVACKPNGEQFNDLLKNKNLKKQIRILREWNFSNEIIASMVGTTPESIRVTSIQMKAKTRKEKQPKPEQKAAP